MKLKKSIFLFLSLFLLFINSTYANRSHNHNQRSTKHVYSKHKNHKKLHHRHKIKNKFSKHTKNKNLTKHDKKTSIGTYKLRTGKSRNDVASYNLQDIGNSNITANCNMNGHSGFCLIKDENGKKIPAQAKWTTRDLMIVTDDSDLNYTMKVL